MSTESQLARIAGGGTLSLVMPGGGRAELSRDDIRAALGFAQTAVRNDRRPRKMKTPLKKKPDAPAAMSMHIVLAKWTDDPISKQFLEEHLAHLAFKRWWQADVNDNEPITRSLMRRLARLMIMDMCQPQKVRMHGPAGITAMMGLKEETWKRKFARHYADLMKECQGMEADVLRHLRTAIS